MGKALIKHVENFKNKILVYCPRIFFMIPFKCQNRLNLDLIHSIFRTFLYSILGIITLYKVTYLLKKHKIYNIQSKEYKTKDYRINWGINTNTKLLKRRVKLVFLNKDQFLDNFLKNNGILEKSKILFLKLNVMAKTFAILVQEYYKLLKL